MSCGCTGTGCTRLAPVYVGALAPEGLRIVVGPSDVVPDLTAITAVTLSVTRPDTAEVTWALTIAEQVATRLVLDHQWLAGDLDMVGDYTLRLTLVPGAGAVRAPAMVLPVVPWGC